MKKNVYLLLLSSLMVLAGMGDGIAQISKKKPIKVRQQDISAQGDSVKTMFDAVKGLFNKNKKVADSNKPKAATPISSKKATTKKTKAKGSKTKPQTAKKTTQNQKEQPTFLNKNKKSIRSNKKAAASKNQRGQICIDTLYYIQPIPAQVNSSAIVVETLHAPISIDESSGKVREVEIGEHQDYFSFNSWEIPTQPDEFVKEKIENFNSILPLVFNDDVKLAIREFTQSKVNRRWLEKVLGRMQLYFPLYESVFDQYGIPVEMKYLSVIESGLNPKATSPMGAKGLWQFMPQTALQYGLKNSSITDEARDPKKATRAAAKYLNTMYTQFGDWFLSMCAYNCGPGNVRKALRRSKQPHGDFWAIKKYLPRETRHYIPKFIAAVYVLNNYQAYNLKPKELDYDLQKVDTIHLHRKINTNDLVKYCGIKKEHIRLLNPILKTNETPVPNPTFVFNIPYSKLENVLNYRDEHMNKTPPKSKAIPKLSSANKSGEFKHHVKRGENLEKISKKYGVSISDLKSWNGLSSHLIRIGQRLIVYK